MSGAAVAAPKTRSASRLSITDLANDVGREMERPAQKAQGGCMLSRHDARRPFDTRPRRPALHQRERRSGQILSRHRLEPPPHPHLATPDGNRPPPPTPQTRGPPPGPPRLPTPTPHA